MSGENEVFQQTELASVINITALQKGKQDYKRLAHCSELTINVIVCNGSVVEDLTNGCICETAYNEASEERERERYYVETFSKDLIGVLKDEKLKDQLMAFKPCVTKL